MNKWAYDNLHEGVSRVRVDRALTWNGVHRDRVTRAKRGWPKALDKKAYAKLQARQNATPQKQGYRMPGSMKRN